MVAAAVIAWLGFLVHNVADLPGQTLLSPETLWPTMVTAALLAVHATGAVGLAGLGMFGWALLNLVGGTSSVLPLAVLPFEPEQTLRHYSFHLLYAATQIPLLVVSHQLTVGPRRRRGEAARLWRRTEPRQRVTSEPRDRHVSRRDGAGTRAHRAVCAGARQ